MFTGIIEHVGRIEGLRPTRGGVRLTIRTGFEPGSLVLGESVAIDGVCLTVDAATGATFEADVSTETLRVTTFSHRRQGDRVNVERALQLSGRLGGHLVSGHVDGVGTVTAVDDIGDTRRVVVAVDEALVAQSIPKGSVTVDGVSLTITTLGAGHLELMLVPHTLAATTLVTMPVGRRVNIETDMIGKYVHSFLARKERGDGVTIDLLRKHGFA